MTVTGNRIDDLDIFEQASNEFDQHIKTPAKIYGVLRWFMIRSICNNLHCVDFVRCSDHDEAIRIFRTVYPCRVTTIEVGPEESFSTSDIIAFYERKQDGLLINSDTKNSANNFLKEANTIRLNEYFNLLVAYNNLLANSKNTIKN